MTMNLLAKSSGETLSDHTIACLEAAQALLNSLPFPEERRQTLAKDVLLAVAIHDAGKAAIGFQKVLKNEQENWQGKRHEIISASFASGIEGVSSAAIFAVLTHHKSIPSDGISQVTGCLPWEQIPSAGRETAVWEEMAHEWKENSVAFAEEWGKICRCLGRTIAPSELRPLSLQPTWLERGTRRSQLRAISFDDRYYASMVRGLTIASDHLGSAGIIPRRIPELRKFTVLKQKPRPFQERLSKIEGSVILRAPTGSGKTEAALLWAQQNQGQNGRLFYILPYTASINAMHRRLANIFGKANVGVLHHRATAALYSMLEDDKETTSLLGKQHTAETLSTLAREIWFPIRVCTPHQILRYTLRGKGWEYMLAEFPNACFIFDEIHAYDPRVVGLTLRSAKLISQWGARCIFLSATLPSFLLKLIADSTGVIPFMELDATQEEDRKMLSRKRHNIEVKDGSMADQIGTIAQAIHDSSSTLIVCNHVRTSQEIYSLLKEEFKCENVRLLHGRFNQEDRNRIEGEIISRSLPKVLVATQVVEVSLDMDFERGFLEPAPIDALIQRMGRINRSGIRPPANVIVFTEQVNPYQLYCECEKRLHKSACKVKRTIDELLKLVNPIGEKDLVEAADRVYGEGYQGEDKTKFEEGYNHPDLAEFEQHLLAGAYRDWVEAIIEKTDGIIEVLPKSLLEEYNRRKEKGLWIEANSLLVPVRVDSLAQLRSRMDMSKHPFIADLAYTPEKGLKT